MVILKRFDYHWLIIFLLMTQPAHAADCVKRVFNEFCLGGDLTEQQKANAQVVTGNDSQLRFAQHPKGPILIDRNEGQITSVTRLIKPGSWLNFTDWKVKLVRIYGRDQSQNNFPLSATSRSSKLNAINANKGYALSVWPQSGWHIALKWDDARHITLQYKLDKLHTPNTSEGL